ncbi:hypothetical protein ACFL25_00745 [Patescibacteria group bacterium]
MVDDEPVVGFDSPEAKAQVEGVQVELERRASVALETHDGTLDRFYEAELEREKRRDRESIVIRLDEIPPDDRDTRMESLGLKFEEYSERYKTKLKELDVVAVVNTMYKRDILRLLLKHGSVNTWAYSNAVAEQYERRLTPDFGDSAAVIHDYVRTGGANVVGGRLPNPKS